MIRSLVLGTILGGLVAFLWSSVSWEVIGWHEKTLLSFQNEDDVSAVIVSHMKQSGTYLLPAGPSQEVQSPEQKKAAETIQMASALLLTWLLLQTSGLRYARRVAFLAVAGLASGVIADLPNWNWWGFSGAYAVVNLIDYTITWFLAGLVIAKVAKPRAI